MRETLGDEAAKEDEIVKGTEGEKREGRSVEEKNRKDDRSEGYHAQRLNMKHTEKKLSTPDQHPI